MQVTTNGEASWDFGIDATMSPLVVLCDARECRTHILIVRVRRKRFRECRLGRRHSARRLESESVDVRKAGVAWLELVCAFELTERVAASIQANERESERVMEHTAGGRGIKPVA